MWNLKKIYQLQKEIYMFKVNFIIMEKKIER